MMRILIKDIKQLVQVEEKKPVFRTRGVEAMQSLLSVEDAFSLIENDLISGFGTMKSLTTGEKSLGNFDKGIDAAGCFV